MSTPKTITCSVSNKRSLLVNECLCPTSSEASGYDTVGTIWWLATECHHVHKRYFYVFRCSPSYHLSFNTSYKEPRLTGAEYQIINCLWNDWLFSYSSLQMKFNRIRSINEIERSLKLDEWSFPAITKLLSILAIWQTTVQFARRKKEQQCNLLE